ncbi:hypothetical protein PR048_011481 [Dryococelus australis]|uniref:Uncharacterized protein n=1 Tax=Dryococelus australis TaxID=614101 RepID=A0ABQ9HLM8_9NEOP|nr:hypothetical protein PR048_011481 [Dryococelus australis]
MSDKTHSRSFQFRWLDEFKWLSYSEMKEGSTCKYCILIVDNNAEDQINHHTLGALLTKPFIISKKLREVFKQHENSRYHKAAVLIADNIKSIVSKKKKVSLRSKNYAGRINLHEPMNNNHSFRSLCRYIANSIAEKLREHLESRGAKSIYTISVSFKMN